MSKHQLLQPYFPLRAAQRVAVSIGRSHYLLHLLLDTGQPLTAPFKAAACSKKSFMEAVSTLCQRSENTGFFCGRESISPFSNASRKRRRTRLSDQSICFRQLTGIIHKLIDDKDNSLKSIIRTSTFGAIGNTPVTEALRRR
ncbi:hypothetical protein HG421_05805 [Xanthomonas campestris pv. badrii]|uniref:Uncharacterized protein n=1 Tax=Xanthomonas campestris pv. badrii TaxID=149696 RepID=A0A7Z2V7K5_XANCA|nr:hypothetical protein [Xanthomonas campestris]MCC4604683.1 hypothetical protein [Xanthomonas campestris pv. parthenii]QJD66262.1 hypothetical protein HG421_05805 [Xanthomonas campestris pv. badrii]